MEIRTESGCYYEVVASMIRTDESGIEKRVKDTVVVNAVSFTDAEEQGYRCFDGEADVSIVNINPATYGEIFEDTESTADRHYYKVKVDLITVSDTGKEKRTKVTYLVHAVSATNAETITNKAINVTTDYHVGAVVETKISEVWHG